MVITYIIGGASVLTLGAVVVEKKLLENGKLQQAKWVHYGMKGTLIGTFSFYLVRITFRAISYFL